MNDKEWPYNHPAWEAVENCFKKSSWQHRYLTFLLFTRLDGWKLVKDEDDTL